MNIFIAHSIFAPTRGQADRNLRSIRSISEYFRSYPICGLTICFGGWGKEEFVQEIASSIRELFAGNLHESVAFDRNYGKAYVMNQIVDNMTRDASDGFVFLLDADIILEVICPNILERLIYIASESEKYTHKPFGLIATSQAEGNCHLPAIFDNSYIVPADMWGAERVCFPSKPSGIAGGAILCGIAPWRAVGGYRPMGVYAGDDAYFLLDVGRTGYSYQVAADVYVVHPIDHDAEYAKWKMQVCHRVSDGLRKNDLSSFIEEADAFWARR